MEQGVIFDMDGVLVLSEDAHFESWKVVAAGLGVEVTREAFLSCFGRVTPDCVPVLIGGSRQPAEIAQIADAKEAAYRRIVGRNPPLAPGARPLLERLTERGVRVGLGSSAPRENVDLILDAGNLRGFFHAVANGSEVRRGKPAPDVFLLAGDRLGLPPHACAVIEDAPAGIRAACAAGMRAIGVATTHGRDDLFDAGAIEVFTSLGDVPIDRLLVR